MCSGSLMWHAPAHPKPVHSCPPPSPLLKRSPTQAPVVDCSDNVDVERRTSRVKPRQRQMPDPRLQSPPKPARSSTKLPRPAVGGAALAPRFVHRDHAPPLCRPAVHNLRTRRFRGVHHVVHLDVKVRGWLGKNQVQRDAQMVRGLNGATEGEAMPLLGEAVEVHVRRFVELPHRDGSPAPHGVDASQHALFVSGRGGREVLAVSQQVEHWHPRARCSFGGFVGPPSGWKAASSRDAGCVTRTRTPAPPRWRAPSRPPRGHPDRAQPDPAQRTKPRRPANPGSDPSRP